MKRLLVLQGPFRAAEITIRPIDFVRAFAEAAGPRHCWRNSVLIRLQGQVNYRGCKATPRLEQTRRDETRRDELSLFIRTEQSDRNGLNCLPCFLPSNVSSRRDSISDRGNCIVLFFHQQSVDLPRHGQNFEPRVHLFFFSNSVRLI